MDDLGTWLERIGLGRYVDLFAEQAIDAEVLVDLTDADLKELGLPLGHRKKLLKAIASLRSGEAEVTAPAARSGPSRAAAIETSTAERRQLSVMFCDLVGSTALSERLDLEVYRELLAAYQDAARGAIEHFDGYIARYMGDGLLVYFGYPEAHEDDAERAVRAGLAVVDAVSELSVSRGLTLRVRAGIATGLVVAGDIVGEGASQERAVLGETPNLAARLQALAAPNSVVIAEATRRLVEGRFELQPLEPQPVKGLREPVRAFQATGIRTNSRFEAATTRGLSAFIGRRSERQMLLDRWAEAREGEGRVVLLSGEPGIGKSRLLRELKDGVGDDVCASFLYQCSPYGVKTAFSPIIEQLRRAAGFVHGDAVTERLDKLERLLSLAMEEISETASLLAALLSLPADRYPPRSMTPQKQKIETIAALVAQLEGLARRQPVLMLVEDMHWSDPSTREVLDAMVGRTQELPVLMVMTHRAEFESPWAHYDHVTHHSLNRLRRRDGKLLAERVTGGKALPETVLDQILDRTDGVPLFIEELTKTVLEAGVLVERNGRYLLDTPLPPVAIPATLQDSLMSRLDRLAPVKEVAQAAACIGREFSAELLSRVLDRPALDEALSRLMDAGLIFRRGTEERTTYLFKHALVQDAAYASLLVSRRRQLHARIAGVLEASAEPDSTVLARHFAAAGVPAKAAHCFLAAGQRALAVSALPEAVAELELGLAECRSLPASSATDRLELDLRTALGTARLACHGWPHPGVCDAFEPAFALAVRLEDQQALARILWGLCVHRWCRAEFTETLSWLAKLERAADRSEDSELSVVRDMSAGCQYFWQAEYERAWSYTARIRSTYDECRHGSITAYTNHDPLCFSLHWAGSLLQWIIGHPDRSVTLMDEAHALAWRIGHPFNTVFALTAGAECLLMRGDADRALRYCDYAKVIADEEGLGDFAQNVLVNNWRGRAHIRKGSFETGYALLRLGTAHWRQVEGKICSALFWSAEAIALCGLGRTREAMELIDEAIAHCRETGDRWMEPEVVRIRGEIVLSLDRPHANGAEALFAEALRIARGHRAKSWELRAATSLAKLWRSQDKASEARGLLAPVVDGFTEGLDTADLNEAQALLDALS